VASGDVSLDGVRLAAGIPVLAMSGGALTGTGAAGASGLGAAAGAAEGVFTVNGVATTSATAARLAWAAQLARVTAQGAQAIAPTAARVAVVTVEATEGASAAAATGTAAATAATAGIVLIFVIGLSLAAYQAATSPDGWWKVWEPYAHEVAERLGEHGGTSWPGGRPPSGASPGEPQHAPGSPVPAPAQDPSPPAPALAPGQDGAQPAQAPGAAGTDPAQAPGQRNDPVVVAGPVPTTDEIRDRGYPMGFKSRGQFRQFGESVRGSLKRAGYPDADAGVQGSAASGRSAADGTLFDEGRISDVDLAVVQSALYQKAIELGIEVRAGHTRFALTAEQATQLGIGDLPDKMSRIVGRPVNIMIFDSRRSVNAKDITIWTF
jgi:hypothetical protein